MNYLYCRKFPSRRQSCNVDCEYERGKKKSPAKCFVMIQYPDPAFQLTSFLSPVLPRTHPILATSEHPVFGKKKTEEIFIMAPSAQAHHRSHSLLLLQKLLNLRDSASPLTLILDSLEQGAGPLVQEFITRAKVRATNLSFPPIRYLWPDRTNIRPLKSSAAQRLFLYRSQRSENRKMQTSSSKRGASPSSHLQLR